MTPRLRAWLLTTLGVLLLSPDSLVVRLLGSDSATILFWRGFGLFALLLAGALVLARYEKADLFRPTRSVLVHIVIIGVAGSICQNAFVHSLNMTKAANVLILVAATPLAGALVAWVWRGERPYRRTWIAIAAAMCGVTLTVAGEVRLGAGQGELVAMIVPIALATAFTASRDLSIGEVWLGYALAGLLTATVQLGAAAPFSLSYADVWLMLLMVTVVGGMSFMLIGIGPRHLRPAEVGLLMLLETTFGPLWVWVGIGEVPSALAFVGGAIVLATLVLYSLSALRAERARVPPIEAVRVTP